MSFTWLVLGFVFSFASVLVIIPVVRLAYVRSRIASFRAVIRVPGRTDWQRGYACYGQRHLVWNPLVQLGTKKKIHFPREAIEMAHLTHQSEQGTTFLNISYDGTEYQMVMAAKDYNGLVAWVESAPRKVRVAD